MMLACASKKASDDRLLVYIMAGQSNMAGRGLVAPEDTVSDPRIFTIDSMRNMVVAREPLHFYHPGFTGLDCGVSFAKALLERAPEGTRICLVPAAMSSTSVQDWLGDTLHSVHLFTNAVSRAKVALDQGGQMGGILWHQGETNAESDQRAAGYSLTLDSLVSSFRMALQSPSMPFFAGTLPPFLHYPCRDKINASIEQLGQRGNGFVVVRTDGLSGKPDSVHFDAAGQRELGRRFAAAAAGFL
jgi:hypothetical protein